MYKPSEELKKRLQAAQKRLANALKEERYDLAEQHAEHLFRQLMQINDADALKPNALEALK